jgi:hypothetical protein
VRGTRSPDEQAPGVVARDLVRHHPAIAEMDVGLSVTHPHPEERHVFLIGRHITRVPDAALRTHSSGAWWVFAGGPRAGWLREHPDREAR